jgi:sulfatase modifying factor 1
MRASVFVLLALLTTQLVAAPQESTTNSVGMEFVLIQPGTMRVGVFQPPYPTPPDPNAPPAPTGRGGRGVSYTPDEYARFNTSGRAAAQPGFEVKIARPFYVGKYEVTQAQWRAVMGTNPSIFQGDKVTDDAARHPVDNVTWEDAQAFVRRLNALEKTSAYRLPTEFEWEYAARAGEDADTPWTVIRERAVAGYNAFFSTQIVGTKKPNAWGLFDMQGNVWEWVQDVYNEKPFADPTPPRTGKVRVLKGGGFAADVKNAIPATHAAGPGSKFDVGFRVVKDVR